MPDKVLARFTRLWEILLLIALAIGLGNTFGRPNPYASEWLSYASISLSVTALFVYGITFGMKLRR